MKGHFHINEKRLAYVLAGMENITLDFCPVEIPKINSICSIYSKKAKVIKENIYKYLLTQNVNCLWIQLKFETQMIKF